MGNTAANTHDSAMFAPLLDGIPAVRSRRGIERSDLLGRHRWCIERTISWTFGYRRLTIRYERKATHFAAFLSLATTLTCYQRLAKPTT